MSRIVHLITGLDVGGAELMLLALLTQMTPEERAGHRVISLIPPGPVGEMIGKLGVPVDHLGMKPGRISLRGLLQLRGLLRSEPRWFLQGWMYHANLLATLTCLLAFRPRQHIWGIHHSLHQLAREKRLTRWIIRLSAMLSYLPRAIIYVAQRSARQHEALGYSKATTRIIHNGYDPQRLQPDAQARARLCAEFRLDAAHPVIGHVARWDWTKDHATFIHALAQQPALQAVLIGKGVDAQNAQLVALLQQAGVADRVRLAGYRADVPQLMPGFDVYCLSSVTECFPNVVAEAMLCGVVCVVTDVGDAGLMVGDTGYVVPPGDARAMAQALGQAASHTQQGAAARHTQNGAAARQRIMDNFTISGMMQAYHALYAEIL